MPNRGSPLSGALGIEDVLCANKIPEIMPLMTELWPICRSVTGPGVRKTLDILGTKTPLERYSTSSGAKIFDWIVPAEWSIRQAYILDEMGNKIIDFENNNLHVVSYSEPVSVEMDLDELQTRLHSIPELPDAIPYLISYYRSTWGFCLTHKQRLALRPGRYKCVVDSDLNPKGQLDFAQCRLAGQIEEEVFFSSYICHPSLANNELSGPTVQSALLEVLGGISGRRLTYRAAFTTETIGTLCFLDRFGQELKKRVVGGCVISCVGDDGPFTFVRSRRDNSVSDRLFNHVISHGNEGHKIQLRAWHPVGSDERQYCSPGFDFPTGSLSRSRFEEFKEYHTSLDNLDFVSEEGLQRSLRILLRACQGFEMNLYPVRTDPYGEPQLGKRGLYTSDRTSVSQLTVDILFVLAYADGAHSMLDIAEKCGRPIWSLLPAVDRLIKADLVHLQNDPILKSNSH